MKDTQLSIQIGTSWVYQKYIKDKRLFFNVQNHFDFFETPLFLSPYNLYKI